MWFALRQVMSIDLKKTMNDLKQLGDEIKLKIHLGGMDARDRWAALDKDLSHLEAALEQRGEQALDATRALMRDLGKRLRKLQAELTSSAPPGPTPPRL